MKLIKSKGRAFINFNKVAQRFEVIKDSAIVGTYSNYIMAEYRVKLENEGV